MRLFPAIFLFSVLTASGAAPDVGKMAEVVKAEAVGNRFMGSVLVAKGQEVVWAMSAGWADAEWEVPDSATTKFRLGSLTKQFTAASILLLQERGKLSVDDLAGKYIKDLPAAWKEITLRQLLTHTSGVPNFTELPPYKEWMVTGPSPSMMMERMRDLPLDFRPGSRFGYSNTGYVLLGWMVELVSGQTYREFVKQNIFEPLGMAESGYDSNVAVIPRRAAGYTVGAHGLRNARYIDMRVPQGAGGLYSTTGDLLKWTQGLFHGKLLQAASLASMTKPGQGGYAFGLGVGTKNGRKRYAHAGGVNGFSAFLAYFPESDVTIAVLANVEGPVAPQLEERLEAIYSGD